MLGRVQRLRIKVLLRDVFWDFCVYLEKYLKGGFWLGKLNKVQEWWFGRFRPISAGFGKFWPESAWIRKKKGRIGVSEECCRVATSLVWVRHPFCRVGASETLEWILIYIYIYILYCITENEWDEFKITKYSRENPIFDAEQIRMFLFHLLCTSCLI